MKSTLMLQMAAILAGINPEDDGKVKYEPTPLTKEEREERDRELKRRKGLKEYTFNGVSVWAINKKNAIRKFQNLNK